MMNASPIAAATPAGDQRERAQHTPRPGVDDPRQR
jgi:hypothetical protein